MDRVFARGLRTEFRAPHSPMQYSVFAERRKSWPLLMAGWRFSWKNSRRRKRRETCGAMLRCGAPHRGLPSARFARCGPLLVPAPHSDRGRHRPLLEGRLSGCEGAASRTVSEARVAVKLPCSCGTGLRCCTATTLLCSHSLAEAMLHELIKVSEASPSMRLRATGFMAGTSDGARVCRKTTRLFQEPAVTNRRCHSIGRGVGACRAFALRSLAVRGERVDRAMAGPP